MDLEDPLLARRAARLAAGHAQVLSRLDFPAHSREDDDVLSEHDVQLPDVGDLLALRHPSRDPLPLVATLTRLRRARSCTPTVLLQKIQATAS